MTDIIAANNTAAEEMSLIYLICSCLSGDTKSHKCSIAELIISNPTTIMIRVSIASHSKGDMSKMKPIIHVRIAITRCIRALCSYLNNSLSPLIAYLKDCRRAFIENFFFLSFFMIQKLSIHIEDINYISLVRNLYLLNV